jgi:oligopeptide transport system permease protein
MANLLQGDLGPSFKHANRSVNELIAAALPVSLELGGLALAFALAVGVTLGILAAVRQNTWLDYLASSSAMVGICMPTFVIGPACWCSSSRCISSSSTLRVGFRRVTACCLR